MSCLKGCLWYILLTFAVIALSIPIFLVVTGESDGAGGFVLCSFGFGVAFILFDKLLTASFRAMVIGPDIDEMKSENRLAFIIMYVLLVFGASSAMTNEANDSGLLQLLRLCAIFVGIVLVWYSFVMALDDTASTVWMGYLTFAVKFLPIYILFRFVITVISFIVLTVVANDNVSLSEMYLLFSGEDLFGDGFFANFIGSLSSATVSVLLYDLACNFYEEFRVHDEYHASFSGRAKKVFFEGDGLRVLTISVICLVLKAMSLLGIKNSTAGIIVTIIAVLIWLLFVWLFAVNTKLVYFLFSIALLFFVERAIPLPAITNIIPYIIFSVLRIFIFSVAAYILAAATIVGEDYRDYAKVHGMETKIDSLADLSISDAIDKFLDNSK